MPVEIGQSFGTFARHNPIIRKKPVNPLDRTTIVSVYPREIHEIKPTMFPSRFVIPAAPDNDFALLNVIPSSWWKEMDEGQPYLEMQVGSLDVAESVIRDFANGLLACNMADKMPGLFIVPGEHDKKSILAYKTKEGKPFADFLAAARIKQINWYKELVRISDVMWARSNRNPLSICDDARIAAEKLSLKKEWLQDFKTYEMVACKACGNLINPTFPVCPSCKAINDPAKAKELGLEFVR